MAMSATDLTKWAQAELVDAVDTRIQEIEDFRSLGEGMKSDDLVELKKERNRLAKFLNLPEKE